jgi:membrane-associated phospholipid phosphatase
MKNIKSIILLNRYFFGCFIFFFIFGTFFLSTKGEAASFLYLNPYHGSMLDIFFINCTFLGDGLFTVAIIVILLLMRRYPHALQMLTVFLLSALVVQVLKNIFPMPRPQEFFSRGQYNYFIEGVTLHGFSSFPSGHSTSVFALATILALFAKNKKLSVLYLFAAIAVGYSRIYLGQHFLGDVLMGSFIGVLLAILMFWLFSEKFHFIPRLAGSKSR